MQRIPTLLFVLASVQIVVPPWTGDTRLPLLRDKAEMTVTRVPLDPVDPTRRRLGGLTYLGGAVLRSRDPAFGGYSSLAVAARADGGADGGVGDSRFTLLSDGGNIVRFRMGGDWRPHGIAFAALPDGPGRGWSKRDRDSESMTVDPATQTGWVGFEHWNAIARYGAGNVGSGEQADVPLVRFEGLVMPKAMAGWPDNGGPESLVRLRDGRFVVIAETARPRRPDGSRGPGRRALLFAGDPLVTTPVGFLYMPPTGFSPADAAELPDGRLIVLNRAFAPPFAFSNSITVIERGEIRAGTVVRGREIARLASPLVHDNFEGIAATREGADTVVWIVSDDNETMLERTLLLKFRLER